MPYRMSYHQWSRHLGGISVLSLLLIIAGCSDNKSTTGVSLSKEASTCYSEYVDIHGDIKNAYKAQASTGIASQSAYGEAHYQTMGASEGRQLPQSCEDLLVISDSCYENYVDSHTDLTAAHQAFGQTKAAFGQNHFNNHGVNGSHQMPQGCSTLYVPPVDKSTWAGSSYTDAQFEAYVNAHPDLLARYNAGNRSESIAQWGRKHYAYFGANEGRSSGLVATIAAVASSGSGGGGGGPEACTVLNESGAENGAYKYWTISPVSLLQAGYKVTFTVTPNGSNTSFRVVTQGYTNAGADTYNESNNLSGPPLSYTWTVPNNSAVTRDWQISIQDQDMMCDMLGSCEGFSWSVSCNKS